MNKFNLSLILILIFSFIGLISLAVFDFYNSNKAPEQAIGEESSAIQNNPALGKKDIVAILPDDFKKPINILALGRVGKGYIGANLTDTIMVVRLDLINNKTALISLPRDLLVEMPNSRQLTKLNNLYQTVGIDGLKQKTEEITGLKIDYYTLVDLEIVKEIVDSVGGLNVNVPQDISDPSFPGNNYSYEPFNLKAGWRYMDGDLTLRYIRTRYTSPNNDFDRMSRQQQILKLLQQKILALRDGSDLSVYLKIFNSLKNHIETDFSLIQIAQLWQIAQKIENNQISHLIIDAKKNDLVATGPVSLGSQIASMVWPKAGKFEYKEIQEKVKEMIK